MKKCKRLRSWSNSVHNLIKLMEITAGVMISNSLLTMIQKRTFYEVCFSFFAQRKGAMQFEGYFLYFA